MKTKQKKNSKKKSKGKNKRRNIGLIKGLLLLLFTGAACVALFVYSVYAGLWGSLPDYAELRSIQNYEASELYSDDGELIGKYYIENRTNVGYNTISPYAVQALIATEDVRFYEHKGIDKTSMFRVFFKTLLLGNRSAGGGSTISQQLAKNLYPREEQQIKFMPVVKLREIFTAYRLEKIYSKDEILTLYLNTVSFGEHTFGIESASQRYFSTSASDLTIPQAATLIGLLKGPSRYNPRLHPERAQNRRNTVINQMVKYEFLTEEAGETYKDTELNLQYKAIDHYSGLAPYLREKIRQDAVKLIDEYNASHLTSYNLYKDGLILTTTLDAEMQRYAEEAVEQHMKKLQEQFYTHWGEQEPWQNNPQVLEQAIRSSSAYLSLQNQGYSDKEIQAALQTPKAIMVYSPFQGEARMEMSSIDSVKYYLKLLHPGMLAVEPLSGKIKVWVGGLDYKYFQYDQVTASRQVGSVFKPVVYSAAIHHGARLDAYYKNEQKTYEEYDNWSPRNSDNNYTGYYTLKGALSKSINTIAVEVLLQTGIEKVLLHARNLGIRSDLPPYPSLALGVADISLSEMVLPYTVFAGQGKAASPYYLSEIRDREGTVIYRAPEKEAEKVLPAAEANLMSDILSAVVNEGTGRRLRTLYGLTNDIAGKTGTTQNQADGWFIGYTPRLVVGVRVGANNINVHFNSTSLGQGANMALPIFGLFMQKCLQSPTYRAWQQLTFPLIPDSQQKKLDKPEFKENINLFDRLKNQKLEKRLPATEQDSTPQKEKKGFFRKIGNLFGKKKK
ncbi:transglycosylase domain-containing protein [Odoribacter lunatus]|uniref:transglycosylase domain-containing protein n=1 Tax=Odoribacter lunatus TaxID=2941335 RepID=UPI00203A75EE|nr:transglycosylase domain-containing protein [Odoribacter lunatus]